MGTIGALDGCRRQPATQEETGPEPVSVNIELARTQTLRVTVNGRGVVAAAAAGDWTVYPAQMGRILELPKHEGDTVEAGDALVRFEYGNTAADLSAHQMDVTSAEARVQSARAQLTKISAMFERGYTSRNELETATSAVTAAELEVARAKAQLQATNEAAERAVVRARFSGIVTKVFHNEGDLVNGSVMDPVIRVVDPTRLEVVMMAPVQELVQIQPGQPATVVSVNGAEPATVLLRPTPADPQAATQDIRLAFTTPTTLPIDSPVEVDILIAERPGVVALPQDAVLEGEEGRSFVMIAGVDGRAHRRDVRLGLRARDRVEIAAGVTPGDRVIVKNAADVAEGTVLAADGR